MINEQKMVSVPREHELKVLPQPFDDLMSGAKTGEVRDCRDREFSAGDSVCLVEISGLGIGHGPTGRTMRRVITHVQTGFGLPDYLCVLSYGVAAQHQGEPVAWTWEGALNALKGYCPEGVAVYPHKGPGVPIPLYLHPQSGEVERLRAEVKRLELLVSQADYNYDEDRAQFERELAEREALMELLREMTSAYCSAIQAGHDRVTSLGGDCDSVDKMLADFPSYAQARAALERKPAVPIEQHGTSSDKYKAELYDEVFELVAGLGYANVTTAVSTLRAEREQLQADLTARDERIDTLTGLLLRAWNHVNISDVALIVEIRAAIPGIASERGFTPTITIPPGAERYDGSDNGVD